MKSLEPPLSRPEVYLFPFLAPIFGRNVHVLVRIELLNFPNEITKCTANCHVKREDKPLAQLSLHSENEAMQDSQTEDITWLLGQETFLAFLF